MSESGYSSYPRESKERGLNQNLRKQNPPNSPFPSPLLTPRLEQNSLDAQESVHSSLLLKNVGGGG
jgi:hypothetical protein